MLGPVQQVQAAWPGALIRRPSTQLLLTSALALYVELLAIRWMPAHVRYLSYFTNFILLASFLGLSVGILSSRRRLPALSTRVFPWFLLGVAVLVALSRFELTIGSVGVLYYGAGESGEFPTENALVLPAAFLLVSILFVTIGRPLGTLIAEVRPPLRAYGWDIAGSLVGIAAFFFMSLTRQPPVVWFGGLGLILLLLAGPRWRDRLLMVAPVAGAMAIAWGIGSGYYWSPYYKIGLTPIGQGAGWELNVNESGHQAMLPPDQKEPFYARTYEMFRDAPFKRAMIIGAGSGSDTAIALANGVARIDAVEIDPVIAQLGREFHPSQPFSDPRVTVHIDDGRSFLKRSPDKYDLIIFALPDSLTLTSQFASLRLESFLFTREAMREARDLLTDDGVVVLYNYYREPWLIRKLAGLLESSFGRPPYVESYGGWGRAGLLIAGPRLDALIARQPELGQPYRALRAETPLLSEDPNAILLPMVGQGLLASTDPAGDVNPVPPTPATDEWPLMYLRDPALSPVYLAALAMMGLIAVALVFSLAPREALSGFNSHMFFLGAAFMLLQTRSLVTFALLFGSTWLVNSLVFFAMLCSVMLAIVVSARWPMRPSVPLYAVLLGTLLFAYLLPPDALLGLVEGPPRYVLASVVAFVPVFVANVVFASSFKLTGREADIAFASNLLGIMVGGMLEYSALLIGYRHLLLFVMAFYLLSAMLLRSAGRGTARSAAVGRVLQPAGAEQS